MKLFSRARYRWVQLQLEDAMTILLKCLVESKFLQWVSLGIERVFTIMEQQKQDLKKIIHATQTKVLVVVLGK